MERERSRSWPRTAIGLILGNSWRRAVIGIALGLALLILGNFAGRLMIRRSGAFDEAQRFIRSTPAVVEQLGQPLELVLGGGKGGWNSHEGREELTVHIKGSKGEGVVSLVLIRKEGPWVVTKASLKLSNIRTIELR